MKDSHFIYRVIEMYYDRHMSQAEIAKYFNVSRMTISRTIDKAKEERYVQVQINRPEEIELCKESQIEKKYGLNEVIIIYKYEGVDYRQQAAYHTADFLLRSLHDDMTIAFGRGRTLRSMVDYIQQDARLNFKKFKGLKLVPLTAPTNFPPSKGAEYRFAYTNYLIDQIASILNGDAYRLLAPLHVSSKEVRDLFLAEPSIKEIFELTAQADLAIAGIGTFDKDSNTLLNPSLSKKDVDEILNSPAVGELLGHVLDKNGNILPLGREDKTITLPMNDFIKIPVRVGVATGIEKKQAIQSVLNGKLINVLITDEEVADYLIAQKEL